ncbi:hypothetical protein SKAU_G00201070 [Synaphobranchus kaupii]|uniref:Uncharacterized protein n=1 Tax=Synaphobranchus kaupii TaxID=118154 RepID=A0A9Q1FFY7_SYNKA|nr:hypothetical protein SKAU_G00201070 [Synaphobranchus kaupii]
MNLTVPQATSSWNFNKESSCTEEFRPTAGLQEHSMPAAVVEKPSRAFNSRPVKNPARPTTGSQSGSKRRHKLTPFAPHGTALLPTFPTGCSAYRQKREDVAAATIRANAALAVARSNRTEITPNLPAAGKEPEDDSQYQPLMPLTPVTTLLVWEPAASGEAVNLRERARASAIPQIHRGEFEECRASRALRHERRRALISGPSLPAFRTAFEQRVYPSSERNYGRFEPRAAGGWHGAVRVTEAVFRGASIRRNGLSPAACEEENNNVRRRRGGDATERRATPTGSPSLTR